MKIRRLSIAAVAAGALALSACGSDVGSDAPATTPSSSVAETSGDSTPTDVESSDAETTDEGTDPSVEEPSGEFASTINIGVAMAPGGYNCNNSASNSVYCAYVDNVTQGSLVTVGPDGEIIQNTEFGTYTKTSDDPLTVEITFDDAAVWSDGTPIDYDDLLLAWAAFSGTNPTGEQDDAGHDIDAFDAASTNGWSQIEMPQGEPGAKSATLVYTEPYADWEALLTQTYLPAHIVAEQAGLSAENNGAELIEAITGKDTEKINALGDFWSNGWNYDEALATIPDVALLPSSGPYKVDNGSNGNLTVVKNDAWWGTPAKTETLVYKVVNEDEWVQAMANGDIDAFDPSNATGDVIAQLENESTITFETGEGYSFSHIDFDSSPEGVFSDIKVRQAFLKCVPRQEMVEKFAQPVNPDAQLLNLREFLPAQGNYEEVLAQVPSAHLYDEVDLEGAKALLEESGAELPLKVRFTYAASSTLRADQVQLVKASCDQAGFEIVDTPDEDVFTTISTRGQWDAVVFGWAGSGLVASGESIYVTGGEQNFGGYSNETVDSVWAEVVRTVDRDEAEALKAEMEEALWADPYNVVLYANPGVAAWSSKVSGPAYNPVQTGITWNAATWTKSVE